MNFSLSSPARLLVIAATLASASGCVIHTRPYRTTARVSAPEVRVEAYDAPQYTVVPVAPPELRPVERPGTRPVSGAVWVSGHWAWTNAGWEWRAGHWMRPRPGYTWEPPVCVAVAGGGFQYHPGYWRVETASPPPIYTTPGTIRVHNVPPGHRARVERVVVRPTQPVTTRVVVSESAPRGRSATVVVHSPGSARPTPANAPRRGEERVGVQVTPGQPGTVVHVQGGGSRQGITTAIPAGGRSTTVTTVRPSGSSGQAATTTTVRPSSSSGQATASTSVRATASSGQAATTATVRPRASSGTATGNTSVRATASSGQAATTATVRPRASSGTATGSTSVRTGSGSVTVSAQPGAIATAGTGPRVTTTVADGSGSSATLAQATPPRRNAGVCAPATRLVQVDGRYLDIRGSGLNDVRRVSVGGTNLPVVSRGRNTVRVQLPAAPPSGPIVVTLAGGRLDCGVVQAVNANRR